MFIVKKLFGGTPNYLTLKDTSESIVYGYTENIDEAAKFSSAENANAILKKSGYYSHSGIKVVEV